MDPCEHGQLLRMLFLLPLALIVPEGVGRTTNRNNHLAVDFSHVAWPAPPRWIEEDLPSCESKEPNHSHMLCVKVEKLVGHIYVQRVHQRADGQQQETHVLKK